MLSVTVVSFITSLVTSIITDAMNANLKPYEYCSAVSKTSNELFIKDSVVNKIKSFPETKEVVNVIDSNTSFQALMGNTSSPIYFITNENDLKEIMDITHMSLSEGRLPHGEEYEVALHESVLKNKNLKIGDYIGNDMQDDEWLPGKYKIVGSLKGEALIGFGNKSISAETYKNAGLTTDKPMALIVVPKEGQMDKLNEKLDQIDKKQAMIYNYTSLKETIDSQIASMNILLQIIIFVVVFILSISVGALVFIIYIGRSDEFGILYAMGYRKSFINRLILKELTALSVVCWLLGYLLSMGMISALNHFVLASKGQTLYFFTSTGLINTLFIPVMVLICAAFPILRKFKKWDAIAVIERRD
jgi:putative ABC transport system permease protein